MRKFLLVLLSSIFCLALFGQDFSNKGKEFWLCFPQHVPSGGNLATLSIFITSDRASSGIITMPNAAFTATFNIGANGIQEIQIPWNATIHISNAESTTETTTQILKKAIHIKVDAGRPAVVAYAQQWAGARSAATLLLPNNVLGKKYHTISFSQFGANGGGHNARSQFQIIAVKNNTVVNITPVKNGVTGSPFSVTLPLAGDMIQYQSTDANAAVQDLTGTLIETVASSSGSCSPIAVFSGSSNITFGTTLCSGVSYDPIWQQLYPVSTWGKNFGFIPFEQYPTGNPYRILASENNTNVYFDGTLVATLNAGQIYPAAFTSNPILLVNPTSITSDKPICVAQYAQSQDCSGQGGASNTRVGDPDMVILNPIEQNISDITIFSSARQNISRNWINVLMKTIAIPSFRINGVAPATPWQNFTTLPGYSYLRHLLPAGTASYRLAADSGFNSIAYGWGNVESYAYSAGTNVKDLYQQVGVQTQYGIETTPTVCIGAPFKFKISLPYCADSIKWDLSNLPGPPPSPSNTIYTSCFPGVGGPDSLTVVNGVNLYWYSLPTTYNFGAVGSYPVTITIYTPGLSACGSEQEIDFDLDITPPPIAAFTWIAPGCPAEPVSFIDVSTSVRPTYRWWWDFGDGNTSTLKSPTHTYAAAGNYIVRYSNITTAGCLGDTTQQTITIPDFPTATITKDSTVCINSVSPFITFTVNGGTAPYTITYNLNGGPNQSINTLVGNSVSIGVPTNTAGTFVYNLVRVGNTGSSVCAQNQTGSATITVLPDATISLTSAPATNNQTICINNTVTNITYAVGGSGIGATVTGLPSGVTGSYAAGVFTITGSPTTSGIFNYVVTTDGPCVKPSATGTISVTADATITLSSAIGTDNQTICINTPITNITYAIGGTGTGGTVVGLPAGLTGTFAGGVISIVGSPTVSGTFNYTVNTTGPCIIPSATGSIIITPDATITLTSAIGTNTQTICVNNAITNITYAIGASGNGATVVGLPTGVVGNFAAGIFTISGTPTVIGTFTYTITTTGPCAKPTAIGTITVTPDATMILTSAVTTTNQSLCLNTALVNITYAVGGSAIGGTVSGLPAGVTGVFAGGIITISGLPTVSGTYNYTATTTGQCINQTATGTIIIHPLPTPNFTFTTPACDTRVINFADATNANVGTTTIWQWNFGDAASGANNIATIQNPMHTFTGPGNYTVSLVPTTSNGCTIPTAFSQTITINERPKAGFRVPEVCINDVAAIFTDTSKINNGTISPTGYQWNFGDPSSGALNTSTTMNGTHLYTAVGSYTVTHIVTSNFGCTDTIQQTIFINGANPVADFSITNATALCSSDSISIINLSAVNPGNVTKVEIYWDAIGMPNVFEIDDFPTLNKVYKHKYPNFQTPLTRTITVRLRAYSGTLCVNDRNINITLNAVPLVQFNAIPDACYDAAPIQITQASEIGGVPGTGVFTGPGVSATGIFNPLLAGIGTHTLTYTYTATAAGCIDIATRTINVLDTATANFSFTNPVCEGVPVSFTDFSTAPSGYTLNNTFWNFGDGSPIETHAVGSTFTHAFAGNGTFNVTMYNTTTAGCRSTNVVQAVVVSPIPNTIFVPTQTSVCLPNAAVNFSNNSSIVDGTENAFTYLWNFGDPTSGLQNSSVAKTPQAHLYSGVGPYTVTLIVTSGNGCRDTATQLIDFIHPQPKANFSSNKPNGICIGDVVVFTDASTGADGIVTQWFWNFGDGTSGNTLQEIKLYTTANTFDVSLYIVNSLGCNSDTLIQPFIVNPYPTVDAGPDRVVLQGGSITLEPIVTGSNLQYLWQPSTYLNNPAIKNPLASNMLDDITYTLTVTGIGGCTAPSDNMFVKVLKAPRVPNTFTPNSDGINDTWKIDYLNTYPNCKVQVFTRTGQLVFESKGYPTPWNGTIKGRPLPFDTYYYIIEPESGRKPITGYVTIVK